MLLLGTVAAAHCAAMSLSFLFPTSLSEEGPKSRVHRRCLVALAGRYSQHFVDALPVSGSAVDYLQVRGWIGCKVITIAFES